MHARSLHAREPGDPMTALPPGRVRAARGRRRPYARDARSWEVGQPRSTCEAAEQGLWLRRWWRKGGWARGTGPAKRAPDTEPGQARQVRWIVCAGCLSACLHHGNCIRADPRGLDGLATPKMINAENRTQAERQE